MKLVNEKGKLFGIINIVDLLALLLVVLVAGAVAWKIFGDRIAAQNDARAKQEQLNTLVQNRVNVTYTVRCSTLRSDYYDGLVEFGFPQQIAINSGVVDGAYVVDAYAEPTQGMGVASNGEYVSSEYGDRVDVIVTIQAAVPPAKFIQVGSQEVRVGKSHIVKTQFWEVTGIIENIECDAQPFVTAGQSNPVIPELDY